MNCSYFAMERRRTFKVNKKLKKKTTTTTTSENSKQSDKTKTKRKYTNERTKNTLHTPNKYSKKFSFGKTQHFIQLDKFTPLSASKENKHRYPLNVNPDWQVALFWQWELLSQAF